MADEKKLRWGILGTGGIARMLTSDLLVNGFTVAAAGSRSLEKARAFADEFGIPRAHGSYEELVADPEVDIVYVATPHAFHHQDALLALRAGKHALVEKAFTLNAVQAQELADVAADNGLVVLEAMWTRFLPHSVRLREILGAGTIGDVRTVIADHTQSLPQDPAHRIQNLELGGGALLDLGIYPVSFAWDVLGAPASVTAIATKTPTGADRQTSILFGYDSLATAVLTTSLDAAGPNRAAIVGTKGWIEIDRVFYEPTSFTVYATDGTVLERCTSEVTGRGMHFQAAELERLVRAGLTAGDVLPPAESVAILATLDEIRRQIGLAYPGE
ncbi:Gfo/Idh/MocA family oxidoreductase [Galbitalea sp. SE-J8]|uniref:Gfo/Idh/MocA family protein n=1 Tax=Galbitalea sp. SE-J8 TaxID=3054952 RepID=UPI00259D23C4|nr:Gfo/Idh/MocA family oxidoreductase [Galbitalea sp. SE-J8]MDM4763609.1 Gfo/Idh/MocA family oxidoreductase [Galbitalea sp. SE-J8]